MGGWVVGSSYRFWSWRNSILKPQRDKPNPLSCPQGAHEFREDTWCSTKSTKTAKLWTDIVFLSGIRTRTMGSLSTRNQGRMSFKRRGPAQVQRFACIFIHWSEKALRHAETKSVFVLRVDQMTRKYMQMLKRLKRLCTGDTHTHRTYLKIIIFYLR